MWRIRVSAAYALQRRVRVCFALRAVRAAPRTFGNAHAVIGILATPRRIVAEVLQERPTGGGRTRLRERQAKHRRRTRSCVALDAHVQRRVTAKEGRDVCD